MNDTPSTPAPTDAGALADARAKCDWPQGEFTFHDDPGEHDPCYVVMPGGAMLSLNHHAGEGMDVARAKFIVAACNAALAGGLPLSPAQIQLIVTEAMLDCWNDICSDTDCHPLDIEHHGGKRLGFHVGHWARRTGAQVAAALRNSAPQEPTVDEIAARSPGVSKATVRNLLDAESAAPQETRGDEPVDLTNHHNALKCPYCNPDVWSSPPPSNRHGWRGRGLRGSSILAISR